MNRRFFLCCAVLWMVGPGVRLSRAADSSAGRFLSVTESLSRFVLPEGYFMEAALADPVIAEPVDVVFDGDGRMYVAEMRAYMQNVDGTDQRAPTGRISRHEDRDGDGKYEVHSVFADGLVLPRMMLPLRRGELLVNETDTQEILLFRDTNGDGVADQKSVWYAGASRGGNLEHQQSGLLWAQDNWIYMTINPWRLRWQGYDQPPLKEGTPPNGGQWGLSQDDNGKLWFLNAGGEIGPLNFQVPIVYGRFSVPGELSEDFRTVYPLPTLPDMQAGARQMRPGDGTLNHFTATCGGEIFRGDRLPEVLYGDLYFSEPVGRMVRRARVEVREGLTYLRNAYPGSEFIRSRDPNFRAVNLKTAPDGTLYLVDMHRGIIQEGAWVGEGSYLRRVVDRYELDQNVSRGRIYRLRHRDFERGASPRMHEESSRDLVGYLAHPNGWWRDTAQRLLVLRGDRSVVDELRAMARDHANPLARVHALWTLEGLETVAVADVARALKDADTRVRRAGLRVGETLPVAGKDSDALKSGMLAQQQDTDPAVVLQAVLTDRRMQWAGWRERMLDAVRAGGWTGLGRLVEQILNPVNRGAEVGGLSRKDSERVIRGEAVYNELCFACHGPDGRGMKPEGAPSGFTLAPPFAGSATLLGHPDMPIAVLLKGLTGPVNGKTYEAQMVPMESNDDEWIAGVLTYVRTHFGNRASSVTEARVARLRERFGERTKPFTQAELRALFPQLIKDRSKWKVSASHYDVSARKSIDRSLGSRWDTQESQRPGMWFQVELPQAVALAGVRMDTGVRFESGFPRGFRVEVSTDGREWSEAGRGEGTGPITEVRFPAVRANRVRLTLTTGDDQFWVIGDVQLYGSAAGTRTEP